MTNFLHRKFCKNEKFYVVYFLKIRYILYRKYANIRKITMRLTEEQIIESLKKTDRKYAPLIINGLQEQISLQDRYKADAIMECSIQDGPSFKAVVEIKTVATPQNVLTGAQLLKAYVAKRKQADWIPLLVAPYIGSRQAEILADNGISWLDLSGNMSIRVSNQIYIERTGKPNRFPDTSPIKKIFQGTSSLVSRALLLRPEGFKSVNEVYRFINSRNANITLSTVSKVLKSLDEEILIDRKGPSISVAKQEKLLKCLTESYINSVKRREKRIYTFSVPQQQCAFMKRNVNKSNYLACGFYAAALRGLATTEEITIFTRDMTLAREEFDFLQPDAEFWNIKFIETNNDEMWFNSVDTDLKIASVVSVSLPVADEIELYLEMMAASPRGPKIAEQLKKRILQKDGGDGQKTN
jgi:Fe2+ or Zn2+ uptake regulation protein